MNHKGAAEIEQLHTTFNEALRKTIEYSQKRGNHSLAPKLSHQ